MRPTPGCSVPLAILMVYFIDHLMIMLCATHCFVFRWQGHIRCFSPCLPVWLTGGSSLPTFPLVSHVVLCLLFAVSFLMLCVCDIPHPDAYCGCVVTPPYPLTLVLSILFESYPDCGHWNKDLSQLQVGILIIQFKACWALAGLTRVRASQVAICIKVAVALC